MMNLKQWKNITKGKINGKEKEYKRHDEDGSEKYSWSEYDKGNSGLSGRVWLNEGNWKWKIKSWMEGF